MHGKKLGFLLSMALVAPAILATRIQEGGVPIWQRFADANRVNPLTLHLQGEFVESNLGTAREPDGSFTLRMNEQYMFVPHCVLVPAGVPVHLRITSADVVHSLTFTGTDYGVKVAPGVVSQATLQFSQQAEYPAPRREFCGAGHFAMRSRLRVIPKEQFPVLSPDERGNCASR
jgi:cytochrome c oxidase subunit 2